MRGIIAAVVIVGVIAAVVLTGNSTAKPNVPEGTGSGPANVTSDGPKVKAVMPVRIVIECEEMKIKDLTPEGTVLQVNPSGPPTVLWRIVKQNEGVPITYIDVPDGWIHTCGMDKEKDKAGMLPGVASFEFEAPRDDTYYLNLRAKWMDTCGNSVWVKIDDTDYQCLEDQNGEITKTSYKWAWHQLMVAGVPKGFKLSKGKHTLWMNTREDGVKLDQWVISSEASPQVGEAAKKTVAP